MELFEKLHKLQALKEERAEVNRRAKELTKEFNEFEAEVFQDMQAQDCVSVRLGDKRFERSSTAYHVIQDEDAFVEWAKENDETLVAAKPAKGLLNDLVRTCVDDEQELPPGLGVRYEEYISTTKAG